MKAEYPWTPGIEDKKEFEEAILRAIEMSGNKRCVETVSRYRIQSKKLWAVRREAWGETKNES